MKNLQILNHTNRNNTILSIKTIILKLMGVFCDCWFMSRASFKEFRLSTAFHTFLGISSYWFMSRDLEKRCQIHQPLSGRDPGTGDLDSQSGENSQKHGLQDMRTHIAWFYQH